MRGHQAEQIAVGLGLKGLCADVEFAQTGGGEDAQAIFGARTRFRAVAVFDFKLVKRGQGNAVSAVEVAEDFKDLGFELVVGVKLREWIGVCSFMNSHGLPASIAGLLRLGRVRCFSTGRCPTEQLAIGK